MNKDFFKQFSYLLLIGFSFIQAGANLFATTVNVSTLVEAPPASLSMVQGEYVFDPSVFWDNFPNYMLFLVVLTLILNWKTNLRKWIIGGSIIWLISALVAIVFLEPVQTEFLSSEYSNIIDPELKKLGLKWFNISLLFFGISILSGLVFIIGFVRNNMNKS
jgi:hypothetical protein